MTRWIYCCTSGRCIIELLYSCIFQTAGMCQSLGGAGDDMWEKERGTHPAGWGGFGRSPVAAAGRLKGWGGGGSRAMLSHKMPCCHLKSAPELPALIKFVTIVTIMPAIPPVLFCSQGSQNTAEARAESPGPPCFLCGSIFGGNPGKCCCRSRSETEKHQRGLGTQVSEQGM